MKKIQLMFIFSLIFAFSFLLILNNKETKEEQFHTLSQSSYEGSFEDLSLDNGINDVSNSMFKTFSGALTQYYKYYDASQTTPDIYFFELSQNYRNTVYYNYSQVEGEAYTWEISHRGRYGNDTCAVVIGPKQAVAPLNTSTDYSCRDQYNMMVDWLLAQNAIAITKSGRYVTATVYTKKFAADGLYEDGNDNAFSLTKDETHTEEFKVWLITSWKDSFISYSDSYEASFTGDATYAITYVQGYNKNLTIDANCNNGNLIETMNLSSSSSSLLTLDVTALHQTNPSLFGTVGVSSSWGKLNPKNFGVKVSEKANVLEAGCRTTKYNAYGLTDYSYPAPKSGSQYLIVNGDYTDYSLDKDTDFVTISFDAYNNRVKRGSVSFEVGQDISTKTTFTNIHSMIYRVAITSTTMRFSVNSQTGYTQMDLLDQYINNLLNLEIDDVKKNYNTENYREIYAQDFDRKGGFKDNSISGFSLTKSSVYKNLIVVYQNVTEETWDHQTLVLSNVKNKFSGSIRICFGDYGQTGSDSYVLDNFSLTQNSEENFLNGSGESYNPYKISSEQDFITFREAIISGYDFTGKEIKQTANITFTQDLDPFLQSLPVFNGTYNGDGFTLSNVNIDSRSLMCAYGSQKRYRSALFASITGTVKNLGILSGEYYGWTSASISDTVTGTGSIENCYSYANLHGLSGTSYAAGLVSSMEGTSSMTNSFYDGTLDATKNFGILSYRSQTVVLENIYSTTETVVSSHNTNKNNTIEAGSEKVTSEEIKTQEFIDKLNDNNESSDTTTNDWTIDASGVVTLVSNNSKINMIDTKVLVSEANDYIMWYQHATLEDTYYLFLSGQINRVSSKVVFSLDNSFDRLEVYNNDTLVKTVSQNESSFQAVADNILSYDTFSIKVIKNDVVVYQASFIVVASNIDSVMLYLDGGSADFERITSDTTHEEYATGSAYIYDENQTIATISKMKGRGNATWKYNKKPFQVKFNEKISMLGMDSSKTWLFLANTLDPSLSRNATFYYLAQQLELEYTIDYRPCDLYINGLYYGSFLVTSKVEVGTNRVEISEDDYLFEIDNQADTVQFSIKNNTLTNKITIKNPDYEDLDSATMTTKINEAKSYFTNINNMIYGDATYAELEEVLDLESFAKYYWLQELSENYDAMYGSSYCYTENGKLHMGPLWDTDNSLQMIKQDYATTNCYYLMNTSANYGASDRRLRWYDELMKREEFSQLVDNVFTKYFDVIDGLDEFATNYISSIEASSNMNAIRWPINKMGTYSYYPSGATYGSEVTRFKTKLSERISFYTNIYSALKLDTIEYQYENNQGVLVTGTINTNNINAVSVTNVSADAVISLTGNGSIDLGTIQLSEGYFKGFVYNSELVNAFTKEYNSWGYELTFAAPFEITFKDSDTIIEQTIYHFGDEVVVPTILDKVDGDYTERFVGFDKEITKVTSDQVYNAVFERIYTSDMSITLTKSIIVDYLSNDHNVYFKASWNQAILVTVNGKAEVEYEMQKENGLYVLKDVDLSNFYFTDNVDQTVIYEGSNADANYFALSNKQNSEGYYYFKESCNVSRYASVYLLLKAENLTVGHEYTIVVSDGKKEARYDFVATNTSEIVSLEALGHLQTEVSFEVYDASNTLLAKQEHISVYKIIQTYLKDYSDHSSVKAHYHALEELLNQA